LQAAGVVIKPAQVESMFQSMDLDKDGTIDFSEFCKVRQTIAHASKESDD